MHPIENPMKGRHALQNSQKHGHKCSIQFQGVYGSPGGLVRSPSELTISLPSRWELRMPELRRADGVRGHAERLRLEPRGQAKAKFQACEWSLPNSVPHGGHEERAGQTGEEDCALVMLCTLEFLSFLCTEFLSTKDGCEKQTTRNHTNTCCSPGKRVWPFSY